MSIQDLRRSLDTLPTIARNRNLSMQEFIEQQKKTNFPDLDSNAYLIAKDWAVTPLLQKVAKKHGLKKTEVKEIIQHPVVHAAMLCMREIYCQYDIIDEAWIKAQRVRAFHMAMGDDEIYHIDRNGLQVEGQETNLTAARGILQDLEKAEGLNGSDLKATPIFNVINHGTMHMSDTSNFLDQFKRDKNDSTSLDSVEEGEFEEVPND